MRWQTLFSIGNTAILADAVSYAHALDCSPSSIASFLPADSNASVNFAIPLPFNSTFVVPKGDTGYPVNPVGLPALCSVSVQVQSPGNSSYGFGLFLPTEWNERFLANGNGGFAGGINWLDMATGTRYGFATMSTDTGHNSTTGSGAWAYQNPEPVTNWAYRALHGSTVLSKHIIQGYYAQQLKYSYYSGCSTGGRQGLKEAELFPEDFDGIIAAAPAWWTKRMQPWTVRIGLANLPATGLNHIPPALFPTIAAEVLRQCDPQDGVVDTVISEPFSCNFNMLALLCGVSANPTSCLTATQITTLLQIYSPSLTTNGSFYFPGLPLGTENQYILISDQTAPSTLGTDYLKYFIGLGPDWNFYSYNQIIENMVEQADPGNASVRPDLSAYHARGGKVLMYHGLSDGLIPAGSSQEFYRQVNQTLAPKGINMDEFLRLFWIPGMGHCSSSPVTMNAPWYIAGPGQSMALGPLAYSVPGFPDPKHDILLAMIQWVENGIAPDSLVATKYANDSPLGPVLRQRPLCMYPKTAKYMGTGDVNRAESWECR